MKKLLTIFALMLVAFTANAQSCPDNNHPHMIDLGLPSGTKWACCNVDDDPSKQSLTNYGSYYAWGETKEHDDLYYSWSTYIYYDGIHNTCHVLPRDIVGTPYDVAHVKWGDSWVMPSFDQIKELLDNCTYEWTTVNGVNGGKFTSKTNGGSIFLPAAGGFYGSDLDGAGDVGRYWYSAYFSNDASYLYFSSDEAITRDYNRCYGYTVRPVFRN